MDDFDEIRKVVGLYVEGMSRGDEAALRRAFHPKASSIGNFDGAVEFASLDEFIAACRAEAVAEGEPVPPWRIDGISLAGDTAVVRVEDMWAGLKFLDTLTLLHHGGGWQIVAKVFLHLG